MGRKALDLSGRRFGKLVVWRRGSNKLRSARWWCNCDCGRRRLVRASSLTSGNTQSCGCLRKGAAAVNFKHGAHTNRIWRIWYSMMGRCGHAGNGAAVDRYAGRGIVVAPEWHDFFVFEAWSKANGYHPAKSIDRIDNDGPYSPWNCRWATARQQANNKSTNVILKVGNRRFTMAEASREFGTSTETIRTRLREGWPDHLAVQRLTRAQRSEVVAGLQV